MTAWTIAPVSVDHYENFPVASWLCPARLRPAVTAIYWFARTADDLADEGDVPAEQRLEDLRAYRQDLLDMAAGRAVSPRWLPVFERLRPVMATFALPLPLLTDLLSAFSQDVVKQRYADRDELLDYCRRSANPVGRLLLHLYGVSGSEALRQSDDICTALQLANFWQDLSVDMARGRYYVPESDCQHHGLAGQAWWHDAQAPAARALIRNLIDWARALMMRGAPLVRAVPGRAGWELRLVVQGGLCILNKTELQQPSPAVRRPRVTGLDVPLMLWRALRMSATARSPARGTP